MERSILKSTKTTLAIPEDLTAYDAEVMMHINAAFSTLNGLGVGPVDGFLIEDDSAEWGNLGVDLVQTSHIKQYIWLKTRLLFDPPTASYLVKAHEDQIRELEWRLNTRFERDGWVDPNPVQEEVEYE